MYKKLVLTGLGMAVCAATALADRSTYDETKTRIAYPLAEPPVIDGVIDVGNGESWIRAGGAYGGGGDNNWNTQLDLDLDDEVRGAVIGAGESPLDDADLSFEMYAGFDSEFLYVAVRVSDDFLESDSAAAGTANEQTWLDDSIEVFVDGDNSNFAERDTAGAKPEGWTTGGQYVITVNNAYREAEAGNPGYGPDAGWYALTGITDSGYDAEFRISLDLLGNPQPGDIIGFTIAVNDDDDGDTNERQLIWVGATHHESTYGNLVLGTHHYNAPKAPAPTVDGIVNANEYAGAEEITVTPFTGIYDIGSGDDTWNAGDHGFSAWIIHDDDAVYIGVDLVDDAVFTDSADAGSEDGSTWEDDSVEIFFDVDESDNDFSGTALGEGQYVLTANGAFRDNEANNPFFGETDDWFGATSQTATGYQVEFKITKFALSEPPDGTTLGFDIALNDDDGNGRKAQAGWNGRAHNEWTYGSLTLSATGGGGGTTISEWSLY